MPPIRPTRRVFPALALLLLSCVGDSPTLVGPEPDPDVVPAAATAASGAVQTGPAETPLGSPLVVRVTDARGRSVAGVAVAWAVSSGGGTLSATATSTDGAGETRTQWTLGSAPGVHTVTATVAALAPVTFSATATAPQAAKLEAAGGDGQAGEAGAPLADSLAVRVLTADGRPVPGVAVEWTVTGGGGALGPASVTTGATGTAKVRWTLGAAGTQTAQAAVGGLAGSPVSFRATSRPGSAAGLSRVGGDGQSGVVGTALPAPLVVRVSDALGNPVAGASVTWLVAAGGGSVAPAISTTDAAGLAQATWTLGTAAGAGSVTAAAAGATVGFAATATAGPAARLDRIRGDGQSATVGGTLPAPLVVRATDAHGNAVAGAPVAWAVTAGGGSLSPAASATDAAGQASATWTLGRSAGANAATASVAGAGPVTFGATAVVGGAAGLSKVGGDGQSAVVGTALAAPLVVRLTDAHGNGVAGATVSWTAAAGGGSLSPATAVTDREGRGSATWTMGTTAGGNSATVTVSGVGAVSFGATATPDAPTAVTRTAGDGQTAAPGSTLPTALQVRATDRHGNPVPGVPVAWSAAAGGGSLAPQAGATDAQGLAGAGWTLGPAEGAQSATATAAGLAAVGFGATAVTPVAAVTVVPGDPRVAVDSTVQLTATPRDGAGNALAGRPVAWTSSNPSIATVSGSGLVTGVAPGSATLAASSGGKSATVTVTVTTAQDAAGPVLTGLSISPATVDVTSAPAQVEFVFTLSDPGSGVKGVTVNLYHPAGFGSVGPWCGAGSAPTSGTSRSGTWKCSLTMPQGSQAGSWPVLLVTLDDVAGNRTSLDSLALKAKGFPRAVTVVNSGPPAAPPALTSLSLSPATVDVSRSSARVTATVGASAGAGVREVEVVLRGGPQLSSCKAGAPATGTSRSGTWTCDVVIPAGAAPGRWEVSPVTIADSTSRLTTYFSHQLGGYAHTVQVASAAPDTTPPVLKRFTLSPTTVNLASGGKWVDFTLEVSDDSEISSVSVSLFTPGTSVSVTGCRATTPSAGTSASGTYTCSAWLAGETPNGILAVHYVTLRDAQGNQRMLGAPDLKSLGFPSEVTVVR